MSLVEPLADFPEVVRVRADNPSPLTLSGTNTWVVGTDGCWVIDPGPASEAHLRAVYDVAAARGGIDGIALTHDHADHSEGAEPLRRMAGDVPLGSGPFEAIPIPGHAPDHVCFVWGDHVCFTGDCVLGEGSVFIQSDLGRYLDGLRALRARPLAVICPGHGPPILDPATKLDEYVAHRLDRERRLVEALEDGLRSEADLLDRVWSDVPAELRPAAAITLAAHMEKLRGERWI